MTHPDNWVPIKTKFHCFETNALLHVVTHCSTYNFDSRGSQTLMNSILSLGSPLVTRFTFEVVCCVVHARGYRERVHGVFATSEYTKPTRFSGAQLFFL